MIDQPLFTQPKFGVWLYLRTNVLEEIVCAELWLKEKKSKFVFTSYNLSDCSNTACSKYFILLLCNAIQWEMVFTIFK